MVETGKWVGRSGGREGGRLDTSLQKIGVEMSKRGPLDAK